MRDIPIIFSGPMVRALLAGRKTMTRRLAWREPRDLSTGRIADSYQRPSAWQNVQAGDRLWVRESGVRSLTMTDHGWTGCFRHDVPETADIGFYWIEDRQGRGASYDAKNCTREASLASGKAKRCPSIHMPRWASRLTLIVTDTKIEPLQDICNDDAAAEGVLTDAPNQDGLICCSVPGLPETALYSEGPVSPALSFMKLWMHLHGPEAWDANPEVVALSFTVHKCNIDQMGGAN